MDDRPRPLFPALTPARLGKIRSASAMKVYMVLAMNADYLWLCYHSRKRVSELTGLPLRSVDAARRSLVASGLIKVEWLGRPTEDSVWDLDPMDAELELRKDAMRAAGLLKTVIVHGIATDVAVKPTPKVTINAGASGEAWYVHGR